jgi:hypothetical protein
MSRDRYHPTDEDRNIVQVLAGILTPHNEIALVMVNPRTKKPISITTLRKAFKDQLAHGRARVKAFAVGKMFKLISNDHPAMIMFYLKTQCGFRETSHHQLSGAGGGPIVTAQITAEKLRGLSKPELEQLLALMDRISG